MKIGQLLCPALSLLIMTGCSSIGESVSEMIDKDANYGKNAPAVNITLDIDEINKAAEEEEAAKKTEEDLKKEAAENKRLELISRADELLNELSTEEKIGQLLLARLPKNSAEEIAKYNFGGYTFYADDFINSDAESISALTDELSAAIKIAPFIAVDEEGGTVVRVSKYSQFREDPFSSPQLLYQRGGIELLEIDTEEKAKLLTSLGINFNLAPVADICTDENAYIYPRTLGRGADETAQAISAIVQTAADNNIASCLKHFPGYSENTDTHKEIAHDNRELYEFYNRDFVPFESGISAIAEKKPAVMVGHTIYDMIDPDYPASLSKIIHDVLRERLEFDGVIITDDMGMDAITQYSADSSVYVTAVISGNDMICVTDYETAYNDILAAYTDGTITDEMLNEHIRRILIMKLEYKIIK